MSSTLIPSIHYFPFLTPPAPQSHAIPLLKRRRTRLTERRNLYTETADLSEEEEDVDDLHRIKEQGLEFYIPLGKTATAQEERADANLDSASSSEASMTPGNNTDNEAENGADVIDEEEDDDGNDDVDEEDEEEDLDADMANLDDEDEDDMDAVFDDTGEFDGSNFVVDPRELPSPS